MSDIVELLKKNWVLIVIGLGVFGAFTINNINANHIFTVSGFYLCLVSFAEFGKILSGQESDFVRTMIRN